MLSRSSRINTQELKKLKNGVDVKTPLFNAKVYESENNPSNHNADKEIGSLKKEEHKIKNSNKILLIISKKNLKKASKRNMLRRQVYSIFNEDKKNMNSTGKTFVIYYMLKSLEQKLPEYSIIEKQITKILN